MTRTAPSSNWLRLPPRVSFLPGALAACVLLLSVPARAGTPDWVRAAASQALPVYPEETNAVVLLDEQATTVKDKGEIETVYRRVCKILRPEGEKYGTVRVYFDSETRLTYLKGWAFASDGQEYEVKENDAVETTPFVGSLFQDERMKMLRIPAAVPGSVIAYEYRQRRRPFVLQDSWWFQEEVPVRRSRYALRVPGGWEVKPYWLNYRAAEPRPGGPENWVWELENVPAIEEEPAMPAERAVAGRVGIAFSPSGASQQGVSLRTWDDVARWQASLAADRRRVTPDIHQKALDLAGKATTWMDKVSAVASYVQSDIRYVAIEIGIGGYQPHAASEVYANKYGDCKDKVTLLSTLLAEIGVKSYYVLIRTERGVIVPEYPTVGFNHVILAIQVPADVDPGRADAVVRDERLGTLLLFDPTDSHTPLGELPPQDQQNLCLLVHEAGGTLVKTPLAPSYENRLLRQGQLKLAPDGTLSGEITEMRRGAIAIDLKTRLLAAKGEQRFKMLESILTKSLGGFEIGNVRTEELESPEALLIIRYTLRAEGYAQAAGDLLLVRPRVLGVKGEDLLEDKPRKYNMEFQYASVQGDSYEIALPSGFTVDELPGAMDIKSPVGTYKGQAEEKNGVLTYRRVFEQREIQVPVSKLEEMKSFYRQVANDERSLAVLKKSTSSPQ